MLTIVDLDQAFAIEPLLTGFGIGCYDGNFKNADIIEGRKDIRPAHVQKVCDLLQLCEKSKRINSNHSSYGLKHTVERHLGAYTSNGELIAAMLLCGFKHRRNYFPSGKLMPNCSFNLSKNGYKFLASRFCNTW